MRAARGTLILLALLAAVGGYILLVERDRPTDEEREEKGRVILDLDPAAITGIRFAWQESTIAVERRAGGRWELVEPRPAAADQDAVSAVAGIFDQLKAERWLEAADVDTAATGIATPWVRVTVCAGDSIRRELAVGELNPTGSAYFARLDSDPRIALLTSRLPDSNFKHTLLSLRERRLAGFDPEAVHRLELITPALRLMLIQEDGGWRIADPPLAADDTAVRTFLDRLSKLEAIDFVGEPAGAAGGAEEAASHGLGTPRFVAAVTGAGDSLLARVEIGARGPSGIYARSTTQPEIVIVPYAVEEDLTLDLDELRDRRLVALGGSEIDTLHVMAGASEAIGARDSSGAFARLDLVRTAGRSAPANDPTAPDADADIARVAADLAYVRVTRFVQDQVVSPADLRRYGLEPPSLWLRLRLRNGEQREVRFGRATPEGVYAYRPGTGVVLVSEATVEDLRRLASDPGAAPASPANP